MLWTLSVIALTLWPALSRLKLAVKLPLSFRLAVYIILIIFVHSSHFLSHITFYILHLIYFQCLVHPSSRSSSLPVIVLLCQPGDSAVLASLPSPYTHTLTRTHRISCQPVAQSGPMNWMLTCLAVSLWHVTVAVGNQSLSAHHGWLMGLTRDRIKKKSNQPRLRYPDF